jgi:serine/threonine-protein kinase
MATHPMLGKELGNYVVRSLLGEGGMGAVFAGEHRFLGTRCAIKVLHGSYSNNQTVTQRFFQEARASLEIDHPNIIKVFDMGQTADGQLYLVMELLEGRSLGQALAEGPMAEGTAARIAAAVADGLAAAHAKGIVHRDLKPDNIFLAGDVIKVLDFGIAKVMHSAASTKTGSLLGTPHYMAPEQAKGSKHVGNHTDIYALGAILFQMITRRPPFIGDDLHDLLAKQLFEPPPRPSEFAPVSTEMEAIIVQCLEKDPSLRPASMIELRDRLALRSGTVPETRAALAPTLLPTLATPPLGTPTPLPPTYTPTNTPNSTLAGAASEVITPSPEVIDLRRSSGRRPRAYLALAALLVAGALGVALTRRSSEPPPSPPPSVAAPPGAPSAAASAQRPRLPAERPAGAAPAATAQVVVRSDPSGATVTVAGMAKGTTPALLTLTLPQEIYVSLHGYRTAHEVVTAAGETDIKLVAEPHPRPAGGSRPTPARDKAPRFHEGLD